MLINFNNSTGYLHNFEVMYTTTDYKLEIVARSATMTVVVELSFPPQLQLQQQQQQQPAADATIAFFPNL